MIIATDILIAAPLDAIWTRLTDLAGYAAWNPYLIRVDGDCAAGADIIVHSVPVPGQPPMVAPVRVISADAPLMRWEGGLPDRSQFRGDHHWQLTAWPDGGTRLDHWEHFSGSLAPGILAAHAATIRAGFERFNAALKQACE